MKWLLTRYLQRQSDVTNTNKSTWTPGSSTSLSALIFQLRTLARIHDLAGIDRVTVELLFHNLAILADEKIHPPGGFVLVEVNSILTGRFPTPITQQRKSNSVLVGERFIGERAIHAHTQDLGVGCFQLLQVLLEVFHLLGSTPGEGKNIKCQHDILIAAILAQCHILQILAIEILQLQVRRHIAHFRHVGWGLRFLALSRQRNRTGNDHRTGQDRHGKDIGISLSHSTPPTLKTTQLTLPEKPSKHLAVL